MAKKPLKALPVDVPFEQLAKQWSGLLHSFAGWNVRGYDYDDLYQELLITLRAAQQKFRPEKGYAFSTYLHQAFSNRLGTLYYAANERKRRIPPDKQVSIEQGWHADDQGNDPKVVHDNMLFNDQGIELVELTYGASKNARIVAEYLVGYEDHDLTEDEIADGMAELRLALGGN
jgi:RNA polymerase sigma factor (sigma-70 family)